MPNPQFYPKFQAFDNNGNLLAGGKLYSYVPGTSTPKTIYSDLQRQTAQTNPAVLDARGEALAYLSGPTDLVLKDATGIQIWGPITCSSSNQVIDVSCFGAVGDGVADDTTAITDALTAGAGQTVYFPPGTYKTTADITVAAGTNLRFENGASIVVATGKTLTINGLVQAGPYKIFSCSGTGKVIITGVVREVYPQWWGAAGDGVTENSDAFQLTSDALPSGGRVFIPSGKYLIQANVLLESPDITWVGTNDYTYGDRSCQIITDQEGLTVFSVSTGAWSSKWQNISFVGNGANGNGGLDSTSICFHVKDLADTTNLNLDNFTLDSCSIGLFGTGVLLHARNAKSVFTDYYQCNYGIYVEDLYTPDNRALQVIGGRMTDCGYGGGGETGMGIYVHPTAQFRGLVVCNVDFENNDYCIYGGSLGSSLITNNVMLFCHSEAIYLDNSAFNLNAVYSGVTIAGNSMSCPAPGNTMRAVTNLMYLKGAYYNVFDNQFAGSLKNGLVLETVYFSTIMNNAFNNCCLDTAANYSGITIDANCGWIDAINNKFFKTIAESLIYNGITNAASGGGGYIHITGTKSYGLVNAEVANTGSGAYAGLDYATYSGATPVGNVTPGFIGQDLLLNNSGTYSWWRAFGAANTQWLKMSN